MSTSTAPPSVLRSHANHEFFVANWPDRLQYASRIERQLLELMAHPCYRLTVQIDAQGIERLHVTPSPGQSSPVTEAARAFIVQHRHDLIAWTKRVDADRRRLQEVGS